MASERSKKLRIPQTQRWTRLDRKAQGKDWWAPYCLDLDYHEYCQLFNQVGAKGSEMVGGCDPPIKRLKPAEPMPWLGGEF